MCSFPGLEHIEQDERISMGIDGNLYIANALTNDSRPDYCCFASFSTIRTIVQKTPLAVIVESCRFTVLKSTTVANLSVMTSRTDTFEQSFYCIPRHDACLVMFVPKQTFDPDLSKQTVTTSIILTLFCFCSTESWQWICLWVIFTHQSSHSMNQNTSHIMWKGNAKSCRWHINFCVDNLTIGVNYPYDESDCSLYSMQLKPPQRDYLACCCPLVIRRWRCCWRERIWSSSVYQRDSMYIITLSV